MTFSGLTGGYPTPYPGSTEGNFTLIPTAGSWFVSTAYGNPGPSIYDGPVNSPGYAVLLLTASGGGIFRFNSMDYSSNFGDSTYNIQGFLGAGLAFQNTGTLIGTNSPVNFSKLMNGNSGTDIDALLIGITPVPSGDPAHFTTSINIDNISVTLVPEPSPSWLCLAGLTLLFYRQELKA